MWLDRRYSPVPPSALDSDDAKIIIDMKGRLMRGGFHDPLVALQCHCPLFSRNVRQILKRFPPGLDRRELADPLG